VYGHDLARAAYEHLAQKYEEMTGSREFNMRGDIQKLEFAQRAEYPHRHELEKIAVDIVKQIWGITDEIDFVAKLNPDPKFELQSGEKEKEEIEIEPEKKEELTPEEKKEVDKRITMNIMTHGAALHQMSTMHHMAAEAINQINPRLLAAYDRVAKGSQYSAWFMDLEMILAMAGIQGGEVKVKWPKEDGDKESEEEEAEKPLEEPEKQELEAEPEEEIDLEKSTGGITVYATAIVFPMLLHELTKGVMEILTAHGLPKDKDLLKKVYKYADKPEHEFFHYLVGPEIWRRFIKVIGKNKLPDVIAALSTREPDEVHKIIGAVVDDPEKAGELISGLIAGEEDETEEQEIGESKMRHCQKCGMAECKCSDKIKFIADQLTDDPDVVAETPAPAPAAPEAPPKEKPAPMPTPKKTPAPTPSPFRPPKPAEEPGPKAKRKG
jgi:hypothetical protein